MRLSKRWFIIAALSSFAVFAACLFTVLFADTTNAGVAVFTGLGGVIGKGPGTVLLFFTYLGSVEGVMLLLILLLLVPNRFFRRQVAFPVVSTTVISWTLNEGIKFFVQRARPGVEALVAASGFSFPSGHAMNNAAVYFGLFFLTLQYMKKGWGKNLLLTVLFITPLMIAFSRVYVGVHYITDVVAGLSLGLLLALTMNQITYRERKPNDGNKDLQA